MQSSATRTTDADWGVDLPRLAGATLLDEAGVEHRTSSLWASAPAVLVFVRHFG